MIVIKSKDMIYYGDSLDEFGYSYLTENSLKLTGNRLMFKSEQHPEVTLVVAITGLTRDVLRYDITFPKHIDVSSIQSEVIPKLIECLEELDEFKNSEKRILKGEIILITSGRVFFINRRLIVEEIFNHLYIGAYINIGNLILNMHKDAHPEERIIYVYEHLTKHLSFKATEILFEKIL